MRLRWKLSVILVLSALCVSALAQEAQSPATGATAEPPKTATEVTTPATEEPKAAPEATSPARPDTGSPADGGRSTPDRRSAEPDKRSNSKDTKITMSFEKADINSVVKFLAGASGVPIVCDPELKGNVSIICLKQIPLCDAFEVVNAALRVRGYTMVGNLDSKVIRVSTLKKAVADNVDVRSGKEPDKAPAGDNMVTQVIPLEYASAVKLKDELKPLVSEDQANITAIASTNTLIITDNAGNVNRVAKIVAELDKDTSAVIEVEIYKCQFSSADALVETLNKIFPSPKPAGQPQQGGQQRGPDGQPQPQVKTDEGLISMKGEIRIAADARTNSLIISAAKDKIALVVVVAKRLDVDTMPEVQSEVIPLKFGDAKTVADQLNRMFEQPQGGVEGARPRYPWDWYGGGDRGGAASGYAGLKRNVVIADMRTNSVIVTATEQNMREFKKMIEALDAPRVLSEVTQAFPLKFAEAGELADTLNNLFRGQFRRGGGFFDYFFGGYSDSRRQEEGGPLSQLRDITVVAEERTNTLLVTGPPNSFPMVKQLIEQLDKRTAQVYIQVAIVDVTLDNDTKFGIEWQWHELVNSGGDVTEHDASTNFDLADETQGLKYSIISDNLQVLLHALTVRSNVKVLSTPRITTADNVEARISIGRDEPFVTSETETGAGNFRRTVDFKNIATELIVTPHVNETSDVIALDVQQTINEIIGREPELDAPIIANRQAQTTISVRDGQTIVIGGIMKDNKERVTKGIPLLSDIPLIGELFKTREWRTQKSELMVFLTPRILKDDQAVTDVTTETTEKLSVQPRIDPMVVTPAAEEKPKE